ncbi:hypothetical protein QAD02_015009 [Eretmocerus hayati]|uniref:Uncharacterized protein n=1 Tax=Eretmocerus hayati TaxID=131215 RepID=A0ACC2P7G2_9HYME|nr:hypothetical protein QAD02_015009 [Eretmocerus hayati]
MKITVTAAFQNDPLAFHFAQALGGDNEMDVMMEVVANGGNQMDIINGQEDQRAINDEYEEILIDHFNNALMDPYNVEDDDNKLVRVFERAIADELEIATRSRRFRERRFIQRSLRDASNPFDMDPESFRRLYRLWPRVALNLVDMLRDTLLEDAQTKIPVHLQVLITLRFLAEGGFQNGVGQDYRHPVSQSRASYLINRVVRAINHFRDEWIVFPTSTESRLEAQAEFLRIIRIPGIIAAVDGFTIRLRRPHDHPEAFWHYREGTSVNVQLVCNARGVIIALRVCPGSNNDQHNWLYSETRDHMLALRGDENICRDEGFYYVLGDSGYASSAVLLTPIENAAENTPESLYTQEHCRARCIVERTIGAVNGVFLACSRSRKLYYRPETVAEIVTACAILHNFRKAHGMPNFIPPRREQHEEDDEYQYHAPNEEIYAGEAERQFIIDHLYT